MIKSGALYVDFVAYISAKLQPEPDFGAAAGPD